jgi:hypothetical protein
MADKVANIEDLLVKPDGIPVGWSVDRVQKYCEWALAVSNGLKGESPELDKRLRELVAGEFQYSDGRKYSALPIADPNASANK